MKLGRLMNKLDLGCGFAKEDGAIGIDVIPIDVVDIMANLEILPLPFAANTFDEIYLNDIIEHLPDTIKTMEELYRIARPDAKIFIRVINWNSTYQATDPTHVRAFSEDSFGYFGQRKKRSYYTHARFDVVNIKRGWDRQMSYLTLGYKPALHFLSRYLNNVLIDFNFELHARKTVSENERAKDTSLFEMLRCPLALKQGLSDDEARLKSINDAWLVCEMSGGRYPIYDGLPVFKPEYCEKWQKMALDELPDVPTGHIERMHIDTVKNRSSKKSLPRLILLKIYRLRYLSLGGLIAIIVWVLNNNRNERD